MNEYSIIGIVLAVIGIFKGKDVWDFLKHWNDGRKEGKDKMIEFYEKQIKDYEKKLKASEKSNIRLKKLLK